MEGQMTVVTKKKKRKRLINCADKQCSGKYNIHYDGAPVFVCDKCGKEDFTWQKFYNEYLQLFRKKENWNNKKDQVSCIIGFFCYMYEGFYGVPYLFVPTSRNPFSAKECKDTWSLLAAFDGNAHDVRKYLYWVFKRGINRNTTITHFGYVNTPGLIRKYNIYARRKNVLRRESKLPQKFLEWCKENESDIFEKYNLETMNDLGAMQSYYNTYECNNHVDLSSESKVIIYASSIGLIKNGKLNIG